MPEDVGAFNHAEVQHGDLIAHEPLHTSRDTYFLEFVTLVVLGESHAPLNEIMKSSSGVQAPSTPIFECRQVERLQISKDY